MLLSIDRYLHSAKSMFLRKINYKKLLKRVILAVFAVMMVVSLPHLLGACVRYFYGSHVIRIRGGKENWTLCSLNSSQWEVNVCGDASFTGRNVSYSELGEEYQSLAETVCTQFANSSKVMHCFWACDCAVLRVPARKFSRTYVAAIDYEIPFGIMNPRLKNSLRVCSLGMKSMRHDPDFVKAVYLGIDLPLRYIIPCLVLVALNVYLVFVVRRANARHGEITRTSSASLTNLPFLRSVVAIVSVFLGCHTAGIGLFIIDLFRVFENDEGFGLETTVNLFLDKDRVTRGLEMKGSAFLLAAVNSAINILLYSFFLPTFREKWVSFCNLGCKQKSSLKQDVPDMTSLEQVRTDCTQDHQ